MTPRKIDFPCDPADIAVASTLELGGTGAGDSIDEFGEDRRAAHVARGPNRTPRCPHGFALESRLCSVRGCVAAEERWLAVPHTRANDHDDEDDDDDDDDDDEPKQYVHARELPLMLQLVRFGERLDAIEKRRDDALYGDTGATGRGVPSRARLLLTELARIDETAIEDPGERGVYAVLRSRAEELASFTPPSPKANAK